MTFEVHVTPWGTPDRLPNDMSAPMHDCLWEIAQEQAVLKRMQDTHEDFVTASGKVSEQDVRAQLDTVCDDNGFQRLDGSGSGRNPGLVNTSEPIKVRIDPNDLNVQAPGIVEGQPSMVAYKETVKPTGGEGVDLNKKTSLDGWIASIPGFPLLPETSKAGLIYAYGKPGVDLQKLAVLGGSQEFFKLEPRQQEQLLVSYSAQPNSTAAKEVDKITADPAKEDNKRLLLVASPGFFKLDDNTQKLVLDRYSNDPQFRGAIDQIVGQTDFKRRGDVEQAHALDTLARYTQRNDADYGLLPDDKHKDVLVGLYNEVLSSADFNLGQTNRGTQDTDAQRAKVDQFGDDRAWDIAGLTPVNIEDYSSGD
jgi:hypothetical protein